jgi:hypothetical protein
VSHRKSVGIEHSTSVAAIVGLIFRFVLGGTLTLLVSRRRSKIAMWVSIALFALGFFVVFVQSITDGVWLGPDIIFDALGNIGQAVAYILLFTPSARRWMNRKQDEKNEQLPEVIH